jgi:hypothetical protein
MLPFEVVPSACIIGIDPGVTGAVAFLDTQRWTLGVIDMPQIELIVSGKPRNEPAPAAIAWLVREINPILIVSEKLQNFGFHPNPDDLMKMGRWRGQIEGIVAMAEVAFEHPSPSAWKARMGLTSVKEHSRLRANALFPKCTAMWKFKKDHDRAEAVCLALYGCLSLDIVPTKQITPMKLLPGEK